MVDRRIYARAGKWRYRREGTTPDGKTLYRIYCLIDPDSPNRGMNRLYHFAGPLLIDEARKLTEKLNDITYRADMIHAINLQYGDLRRFCEATHINQDYLKPMLDGTEQFVTRMRNELELILQVRKRR